MQDFFVEDHEAESKAKKPPFHFGWVYTETGTLTVACVAEDGKNFIVELLESITGDIWLRQR